METLINSQGYQHIVEEIILNLDLDSLIQMSSVNKCLYNLIITDTKFWFNICRRNQLLEEDWLDLVKKPKNNRVKKSFLKFFKNLLMLDKIENDKCNQETEKLARQTYGMTLGKPQFSTSNGNLVFGHFKEPNNETVYKMFWYHKNKPENSNEFDLAMFLNDKILIDFIRETFPDIEVNDLFTTAVLRFKYESCTEKYLKDKRLAKLFASLIENPNPTFEDGRILKHEIENHVRTRSISTKRTKYHKNWQGKNCTFGCMICEPSNPIWSLTKDLPG